MYIEPPKLVAVNHSAIEKVIEAMNVTHFNGGSIEFQHDEDMGEIAFDDPIGTPVVTSCSNPNRLIFQKQFSIFMTCY